MNMLLSERYISEKLTEPEALRIDRYHFSLIFVLYRWENQVQERGREVPKMDTVDG